MTYLEKWDYLYSALGIKEFIYFISSPAIQQQLFGIKIIFLCFAAFFLAAIIYFYINSSYLQYQFLQDTSEFFSWQPYGLREVNKRWGRITKRIVSGTENEYKLALIEADDFLYQILEEKQYKGETFEELLAGAKPKIPNYPDVVTAHNVRNEIVYNSDYSLDLENARQMLSTYESVIKNVFAL